MSSWNKKSHDLGAAVGRAASDIAVALEYEAQEMHCPQVAAVGQQQVAKEMAKIARRYGIPIERDGALAKQLSTTKQGETIPTQLYYEVAQLLTKVSNRR